MRLEKNYPVLSVVIPHKGSWDSLRKCIRAVQNQSLGRDLYEIILVINQERAGIREWQSLKADLTLFEPKFYSYAARNAGIDKTSASILAFTDSDTVPDYRWLEEGLAAIQRGAQIVAGAIELDFTTRENSLARNYQELFSFPQELYADKGMGLTANLFVRARVFKVIGNFNPYARSGEDLNWTHRASRSGIRLSYAGGSIVRHRLRSGVELFKKAARVGGQDSKSRPMPTTFGLSSHLIRSSNLSKSRKIPIRILWLALHLTSRASEIVWLYGPPYRGR